MKKVSKPVENSNKKQLTKRATEKEQTLPERKKEGEIPNLLKKLHFNITYY